MATFEEDFLYPLILLLVGAGVSGVLVAWLTNRWQDRRRERDIEVENRRKEREIELEKRRKELEIKVDIASKMMEVLSYRIGEALVFTWKRKDTLTAVDEDALYEKFNKWYVDTNIITSKLESYFSGASGAHIKEKWVVYNVVLDSFYIASLRYFLKDKDNTDLRHHLKIITDYFADNEEVRRYFVRSDTAYDRDQWFNVSKLLADRGDEIIKELLFLPAKIP